MEITVDYLKDKVHEQYLELQELRKSYDELTKSALRLDKMVKEKQEEIDQLKTREKEHQRLNGELREENKKLNNIINELEKDFERKIQSCTIEAETTTNDFYCKLHIATLKRWLNKIKELKGSDKEC